MFGANAIWGLMSPVAKFVMLGGIVTPLAVTDLRIVGAMILFWILSFFRKSAGWTKSRMICPSMS